MNSNKNKLNSKINWFFNMELNAHFIFFFFFYQIACKRYIGLEGLLKVGSQRHSSYKNKHSKQKVIQKYLSLQLYTTIDIEPIRL